MDRDTRWHLLIRLAIPDSAEKQQALLELKRQGPVILRDLLLEKVFDGQIAEAVQFMGSSAFHELSNLTCDSDPGIRLHAYAILRMADPQRSFICAAINALHHGDAAIRWHAIQAIFSIDGGLASDMRYAIVQELPDIIPDLRVAFSTLPDNERLALANVVQHLVQLIVTWDEAAVFRSAVLWPFLLELLHNSSPYIRRDTMEILLKLDQSAAYEPVCAMLHDRIRFVRAFAAKYLYHVYHDPRGYDVLEHLLTHSSQSLRRDIIHWLTNIGDERAYRLISERIHDGTARVRRTAEFALADLQQRRKHRL